MRYHKMHRHWAKFGPPVYMSVAGYMGLIEVDEETAISNTAPKGTNAPKKGTMNDLAAMFKSGDIS